MQPTVSSCIDSKLEQVHLSQLRGGSLSENPSVADCKPRPTSRDHACLVSFHTRTQTLYDSLTTVIHCV